MHFNNTLEVQNSEKTYLARVVYNFWLNAFSQYVLGLLGSTTAPPPPHSNRHGGNNATRQLL